MAGIIGASTTTKEGEVYKPFPFFGNQIILSSERIHLHAKEDSIILTGKKSIALSTIGSLNLDAEQKVTVNSPKIYLGLQAVGQEEPIILGQTFLKLLRRALEHYKIGGSFLGAVGDPPLGSEIAKAGTELKNGSALLIEAIETGGLLSVVSYTQ